MISLKHQSYAARATRGFTLAEVLVAMAVFALGFVAVAAMFPTAILMQRETVRQVQGEQFSDSGAATVLDRGFSGAAVNAAAPLDTGSQKVFEAPDALSDWSLADRSYIAQMPTGERRLFWVPVFLDANPGQGRDWRVYLFTVGRQGADLYTGGGGANAGDPTTVPRIRGASSTYNGNQISDGGVSDLRVGNKVVDQWGKIYTVKSTTGSTATLDNQIVNPTNGNTTGNVDIWYAVKGNSNRSSYVDVQLLLNNAGNRLIR